MKLKLKLIEKMEVLKIHKVLEIVEKVEDPVKEITLKEANQLIKK